MSEIKFSKNFTDYSVQSGANAGFQFEFNCERCGDAWRAEFVPYRGGQTSSWLGKAAGMFGGIVGEASTAAEGLAQAGYGKAHDAAFAAAIEQARNHFHRCARCMKFACDTCWNKEKGMCRDCRPMPRWRLTSPAPPVKWRPPAKRRRPKARPVEKK